ncbi:docking protein 2-like [Acanthaster planci]|uniref:Docking protein 2-like n=1 Tax=Acanthaster planci TaxID=133434 RepID=A0A8B7Y2B1_ACAPL|nr:docking protein 2-like [Acanthaster planci]
MEIPPIKKGYLYRPQKAGLKKHWVKRWTLLYPASEAQPPRLETFDSKEAAAKEGTKPSLIILSGTCQATQTTQHRSRDFVMDLTVEEKIYVYAVDSQEELDTWLQVLGEVTAGRPGNRASIVPDLPSFSSETGEGLQENTLYDSYETMTFNIAIKPTAFSDSLNLQGNYTLQIDSVKLSLLDENTNNVLYAWPYRYLRRYGRDKTSFSMEAGRKCESGPGLIMFETKDGNDIFHNIQNFVNNISGRQQTPPVQSHQSHSPSFLREGHHPQLHESGRKPASPAKVGSKPPLVVPRAGHPAVDPVSALVTESTLFKQKLAQRKGAEDPVEEVTSTEPRKPKQYQPRGSKERPPPTQPALSKPAPPQPEPVYSEVTESLDPSASEPLPPMPEGEYSLPESSDIHLRPPMPATSDLPESSEYDVLNSTMAPRHLYDTTVEEPIMEGWRMYGRTEDNIHTENYIKGLRILEDEEPSSEPEPTKPIAKPTTVKSKPPTKPMPLPKARQIVRTTRNAQTPDTKKDPPPTMASDKTYDLVGALLPPGASTGPAAVDSMDVYDHFVRPAIIPPVPAPRKTHTGQMSQADESELYDHLQREANTGGSRMTPKPYIPKQRSFDPEDAYDVLRVDDQAAGASLGAGVLPEESQYIEANLTQPGSNPSASEMDENPYDVVVYQ